MIKVIIADDQELIRESLKIVLDQNEDIEVTGVAENGQILMDMLTNSQPDVILMNKTFSIGSFIFTPDCLTLEHKGKVTRLSIYQTKVLYLLYVCMNMIVTREEIYRMIWHDVVVTDQSLNNIISQLRKLLSTDSHISIDTIRGVGYRLKNNS